MLTRIAIALALVALVAAPALAQTTTTTGGTTTGATTSSSGAFAKLSPGNQKIAQALFDAQKTSSAGGTLTLDQIATLKQRHQGWGNVFKTMKEQGLVDAKNLGQVVSTASKHQTATSTTTTSTTTPSSSSTTTISHGNSANHGPSANSEPGSTSGGSTSTTTASSTSSHGSHSIVTAGGHGGGVSAHVNNGGRK